MEDYRGVIRVGRENGSEFSEVELRTKNDCEDCMSNDLLILGDGFTKELEKTWGGKFTYEIVEIEK